MGEPPGLEFLSKSEQKRDGEDDEEDPDEKSDSCDDRQSGDETQDNANAPGGCEEEQLAKDIAGVVLSDESALPVEPDAKVEEEDERSPQEVMDELLERAFLQG